MTKRPWMKFYPADWRAEVRLKKVSRAARSLWIDLLCLMHEGGGHRLQIDGKKPTERDLANILGDDIRTIKRLLNELESAGVFSRDDETFIISRRRLRDKVNEEASRTYGKLGGNPSLKNKDLDEKGVNPPLKAHIPEARSQSLDICSNEHINAREARYDWPADAFDQFWARYPNKVGKAACKKKWDALRRAPPIPLAKLMEALERYIREKPLDQKWCHPLTWLNQGRWDDEPEYVNVAKPQNRSDALRSATAKFLDRLDNAEGTGIPDQSPASPLPLEPK